MGIYFLAVVFVLLALLGLFFSFKALIAKAWFLHWLRGTLGIFAFIGTLIASTFAYNLIHYSVVEDGQVIATLSFVEVAPQEFDVELVDKGNNRQLYRVQGDQWQLDVRLIKFSALFDGDLPAYKLDRLSGRYLSLEQENQAKHSAYDLLKEPWLDTWSWMANQKWLDFVKVKYGSATYMPMADGAIYQVRLFHDGLDANAVNEQAKSALNDW